LRRPGNQRDFFVKSVHVHLVKNTDLWE
jgi:hypothetical protein